MPAYTVAAASKKKDVQGDHGLMQVISLTLQEYGQEPVQAEWFTKAETPLPETGSKLEGTLSQGQYGMRFKKTPAAGGFRGGGKPPEERRSIAMQHAQKCAVTLLELAASHGSYKPPEKVADMAFHVKSVASSLFEQIQKAEAGS